MPKNRPNPKTRTRRETKPRAPSPRKRPAGVRKTKRPKPLGSRSRVADVVANFRRALTDAARAGQAVSDVADHIARAAIEGREDALVAKLAQSRLLPDVLELREEMHQAAAAGTLPPQLRPLTSVVDGLLNFLRDELEVTPMLRRGERVEVDAASARDFDVPGDNGSEAAGSAVLQVVQAGWRHRVRVILRPTAERVADCSTA